VRNERSRCYGIIGHVRALCAVTLLRNTQALYTSCTEEGAGVAIKRYLNAGDPARIIVPLQIIANRIYDTRETDHSSQASVVWQDSVARGEPAPTWGYSDTAREAGAQGMLYSSRSRPDLTHFVLFDVSAGIVTRGGDIKAWSYQQQVTGKWKE